MSSISSSHLLRVKLYSHPTGHITARHSDLILAHCTTSALQNHISEMIQSQSQPRRGAGPQRGRRRPRGKGSKSIAKPTADVASRSSSTSAVNGSNKDVAGSTNADIPSTQTEGLEDTNQEQDLCLICAEPVKYYAVSDCNHRTCHVCALRLRALYKKLDCTFCKVRPFRPSAWHSCL